MNTTIYFSIRLQMETCALLKFWLSPYCIFTSNVTFSLYFYAAGLALPLLLFFFFCVLSSHSFKKFSSAITDQNGSSEPKPNSRKRGHDHTVQNRSSSEKCGMDRLLCMRLRHGHSLAQVTVACRTSFHDLRVCSFSFPCSPFTPIFF